MTIVTRFAPSPTGYLHIGGARTALFNWLYTRHHGGTFRLRIEDTDRARSTDEAIRLIGEGLKWLGIDWDGETVMQFARAPRHAEVAHQLLAEGKAYRCYCTQEELEEMRTQARAAGKPMRYDGRWRDRDPKDGIPNVPPVIRLKAPQTGETVIDDLVQGRVTVANDVLDDMVLLRGDGTPTYMLSVVVDDHDMDITHVIRGDDHLNNAFRQYQLYKACGWDVPKFAHIPLIHGPDGAKLSKRHGALGVEAYREMGYLPETMRNYLLRLGWGHGDEEIISDADAIKWFDIVNVGRNAARLDMAKLDNLNGHYMRLADDSRLARLVAERLAHPSPEAIDRITRGMAGLKQRAKTVVELTENARFYAASRPIPMSEKAVALLTAEAKALLAQVTPRLAATEWTEAALEAAVRAFVEETKIKLGQIAQPLRVALVGDTTSPGIFDVMAVLGREEALGRLADAAKSPA
jgi:glutamyl-tRNA synthetase